MTTLRGALGRSLSTLPSTARVPALNRQFGIPNPVYLMLGILLILWIILNKTDIGQKMQAVGSNIEATRLSGIRVDRIKMFEFATAEFCAAITGILRMISCTLSRIRRATRRVARLIGVGPMWQAATRGEC
jgi:ribose transport system permease protein